MKSRDEITAEMRRWSEHFIEQPDPVFGGLPICPFAKAARLKCSIRFEVLSFASDPFEPDSRVMTLIGESSGMSGSKPGSLFIPRRTGLVLAPSRPGSSA